MLPLILNDLDDECSYIDKVWSMHVVNQRNDASGMKTMGKCICFSEDIDQLIVWNENNGKMHLFPEDIDQLISQLSIKGTIPDD